MVDAEGMLLRRAAVAHNLKPRARNCGVGAGLDLLKRFHNH
jgi:hypothetical protein